MAVAGLAFDELSTAQQAQLVNILNQHPDLAPVMDAFDNERLNPREFVMAMATWPDRIKQSTNYHDNGYEAGAPAVTAVSADQMMHKGWHFIDQPVWIGQDPQGNLPATPPANAVGVVNVLVRQLQSGEPDPAKAYDIAWLLHLVGDLHQPLHAVTGTSALLPRGDTGGNDVLLTGPSASRNGERELHAFWDDILGKSAPHGQLDADLETAESIISSIEANQLTANADDTNPQDWANESKDMALRDVYPGLRFRQSTRPGKVQATLPSGYVARATADAQERIRVAGHRLALILKSFLTG